ncbi:MAG TPA: FAD-binding oxidoreductase [Chthoniobacterales bacterium]
MQNIRIFKTNGTETLLKAPAVEAFKASLRGELLTQDSPGYDEIRVIWNAMIDRRPALIVRCQGTADVMRAVAFARQNELLVAIRGGGHNIAGNALCEGGMMIDLSPMKSVHVDPDAKRGFVEPGATLSDFDHEAQVFGLATPLGINSTTGVAGLTLGGGFGWLTRKYGMTVDNLVSVEVITADARRLRASEKENADLFWAIRGGGGNFGIVTLFEFQLHEVGPEVLSGLVVFPFKQARDLLIKYREFVDQAPEDLNVWVVLRQAPPLPFLPPEVHGKEVLVFPFLYTGTIEEGRKAIEPLRQFGQPHGEHFGPQPYSAWQKAFDPLLTPGARNYWKSHNFSELNDGAIDAMIESAGKLPTPQCEILIGFVGGQANRVPKEATAYAHRDARYVLNVHGRWESPEQDKTCISWARDFFDASAKYATGGVYVNFLTQDETDRIPAAYGPNYDRLAQLKAKYDATNVFRLNQNIRPAI